MNMVADILLDAFTQRLMPHTALAIYDLHRCVDGSAHSRGFLNLFSEGELISFGVLHRAVHLIVGGLNHFVHEKALAELLNDV